MQAANGSVGIFIRNRDRLVSKSSRESQRRAWALSTTKDDDTADSIVAEFSAAGIDAHSANAVAAQRPMEHTLPTRYNKPGFDTTNTIHEHQWTGRQASARRDLAPSSDLDANVNLVVWNENVFDRRGPRRLRPVLYCPRVDAHVPAVH